MVIFLGFGAGRTRTSRCRSSLNPVGSRSSDPEAPGSDPDPDPSSAPIPSPSVPNSGPARLQCEQASPPADPIVAPQPPVAPAYNLAQKTKGREGQRHRSIRTECEPTAVPLRTSAAETEGLSDDPAALLRRPA